MPEPGITCVTVKWRLLDQTVNEVRKAFADVPAAELNNMIDEAVKTIRKEKHRERHARRQK